MAFTLKSIGDFISYVMSAAFHQMCITPKLKEIHKHYFREAPYRRTVFKEVTKILCPSRDVILTLSMLHVTIVSLSCLVEKVPSKELFSAQSLVQVWYDRFLDDADKYMCKNRTAPSDLPASLLLCQIWNNYLLPELSVHVSNYTKDTKDICSCVKLYYRYLFMCQLYRSYLFMCQIWNNYLLPKLSLATNIYHTNNHSVSSCKYS